LHAQMRRFREHPVMLSITTTPFGIRKPGWTSMAIQVSSFVLATLGVSNYLTSVGYLRRVAIAKHLGLVLLRMSDSFILPINVSLVDYCTLRSLSSLTDHTVRA
jgi:hypothetical protein